jgi:hypothetical protein
MKQNMESGLLFCRNASSDIPPIIMSSRQLGAAMGLNCYGQLGIGLSRCLFALSALCHRLEYAVGTHGDTLFAAPALFGVLHDNVLVKPHVQGFEHAKFAFVDTLPAGRAFVRVYAYVFRASS